MRTRVPMPGPGQQLHAEVGVVRDRHDPDFAANIAVLEQKLAIQLAEHMGERRCSDVVTTRHYAGEGLRTLASLDLGSPTVREALKNPRAVLIIAWTVVASQPTDGRSGQ